MAPRSFWSIWLREFRKWLDEIAGNRRWLRRLYTVGLIVSVLFLCTSLVIYFDKNIHAPWYAAQALCRNAVIAFRGYTMPKPEGATEDIIDRALIDMIDLCEPYLLQR